MMPIDSGSSIPNMPPADSGSSISVHDSTARPIDASVVSPSDSPRNRITPSEEIDFPCLLSDSSGVKKPHHVSAISGHDLNAPPTDSKSSRSLPSIPARPIDPSSSHHGIHIDDRLLPYDVIDSMGSSEKLDPSRKIAQSSAIPASSVKAARFIAKSSVPVPVKKFPWRTPPAASLIRAPSEYVQAHQ